MTLETLKCAMLIAFEAGKWAGQVELEEHYDRAQYAEMMLEVAYSRKNAMPLQAASDGRTVKVNLRSQQWRDGVRKSAHEYLEKAFLFATIP